MPARSWRPEPGDVLSGTVWKVAEIDPKGKGEYPIIDVRSPDTGRRHVCHGYRSKDAIRALDLRRGDVVRIECIGFGAFKIDIEERGSLVSY